MPRLATLFALSLILPSTTPAAAQQPTATAPFRSRTGTFELALPATWRQLAPGEVAGVQRAIPDLPFDIRQCEPSLFYAVGPIEQWHQGAFDGEYLYVVEQDNEWVADAQLAERLQAMWSKKGERDGVAYAIADVTASTVGKDRHPIVTCRRTTTPPAGRPQQSLDVHVPTGGRELTLCFTCWADEFGAAEPRFRQYLATLSLARRARGETGLTDRLWTPMISGAVIGLILLLLYRKTRRTVGPMAVGGRDGNATPPLH